jgi:hypothetical protein
MQQTKCASFNTLLTIVRSNCPTWHTPMAIAGDHTLHVQNVPSGSFNLTPSALGRFLQGWLLNVICPINTLKNSLGGYYMLCKVLWGEHSQNKGLPCSGALFWECLPPSALHCMRNAQLLNILDLKSSSAERRNFCGYEVALWVHCLNHSSTLYWGGYRPQSSPFLK